MAKIVIIDTCGSCPHARGRMSAPPLCGAVNPMQATDPSDIPPDFCPLADSAIIGELKPLEWEYEPTKIWAGTAKTDAGTYFLSNTHDCQWSFLPDSREDYKGWQNCVSIEDGKAACESHHRARMFAAGGPLRRIEGGNV